MERQEVRTANSTFAIGGVSCSADSLEVSESFVLRIKFSGKNPAHRKSANRFGRFPDREYDGKRNLLLVDNL